MDSGEIRPFYRPFGEPGIYRDGIDAQGDDREDPPYDVLAKELSSAAVELQPPPFDQCMAGLPLLHQGDGPGQGDAERNAGDQKSGNADEEVLTGLAIELEVFHKTKWVLIWIIQCCNVIKNIEEIENRGGKIERGK